MILAYIKLNVKNVPMRFAVIGHDLDDVLLNASKIGTDPVLDSELFQLNKDW